MNYIDFSSIVKESVAYVSPIALAISFFIETSSWWVRTSASKENVGLYISRSNIYLYGGRFFALIFSVLLAIDIESGASSSEIAFLFSICFMLSFIFQTFLLKKSFRILIIRNLSLLLLLPYKSDGKSQKSSVPSVQERRLFIATLVSTFLFSIGISLPLFVASVFFENRLVLSNLGQLINSFGMIVLLFFVDQKIYSAFDGGYLFRIVYVYSTARAAAFFLVSALYLTVYGFLP